MHSGRLTVGADGCVETSVRPLSDPPIFSVSSEWKSRPAWAREEKVSSRQKEPRQLLGQPLPRSPPQPRSSAAESAGRVQSGHSPAAGSPWRPGLRDILQPSALLKEPGVERDPRASDQAEGPCGAACPQADPGRAPILLLKSRLPCAPRSNRNTETDFGGRERWLYFSARQKGRHSRLAPQELCPTPASGIGDFICGARSPGYMIK